MGLGRVDNEGSDEDNVAQDEEGQVGVTGAEEVLAWGRIGEEDVEVGDAVRGCRASEGEEMVDLGEGRGEVGSAVDLEGGQEVD